jgi:hypothetical protein
MRIVYIKGLKKRLKVHAWISKGFSLPDTCCGGWLNIKIWHFSQHSCQEHVSSVRREGFSDLTCQLSRRLAQKVAIARRTALLSRKPVFENLDLRA